MRLDLEAVNHVDEENLHIRTRWRRNCLAVVRARQTAPGKDGTRVVLDGGVSETDLSTLGKAVVVPQVPLLGSVVTRAANRRTLQVIRLGICAADGALADRNGHLKTPLHGLA